MKVVAVVQARMGSSRLPDKVMKNIGNTPMIGVLISRLSRACTVDEVVVATSEEQNNVSLTKYVESIGFRVVSGSEVDVLARFFDAMNQTRADVIVRITGDCPLVDPGIVDAAVQKFLKGDFDYLGNVCTPSFPDGLDVEVFHAAALKYAHENARSSFEREHVTPYLRNSKKFKCGKLVNNEDLSLLRWTVDEASDLKVIRHIFEHFSPNIFFSWKDVLKLKSMKPDIFKLNAKIKRNEGATMNKGQKLWKRAKKVIPVEICFYPSVLIFSCQICGQRISAKLKDAKFGI